MAIEFLVRTDSYKDYQKGAISQMVRETPCVWGSRERLPDFLIFRIHDASISDIEQYSRFWEIDYTFTDDGDVTTITCPDLDKPNRALPSQATFDKFVAELINLGVPPSGITQHGSTHTTVTKEVSTEQIRDLLTDSFNDIHLHRRYTLSDSYIDSLVLAGNDVVEVSLAEFQSHIVDGAD